MASRVTWIVFLLRSRDPSTLNLSNFAAGKTSVPGEAGLPCPCLPTLCGSRGRHGRTPHCQEGGHWTAPGAEGGFEPAAASGAVAPGHGLLWERRDSGGGERCAKKALFSRDEAAESPQSRHGLTPSDNMLKTNEKELVVGIQVQVCDGLRIWALLMVCKTGIGGTLHLISPHGTDYI